MYRLLDFLLVTALIDVDSLSVSILNNVRVTVDGNDAANRVMYDSGIVEVDIPTDSLIRLSFRVPERLAPSGWIFGLDNVALRTLTHGDANGDGRVDAADLNMLALNWRSTDKTWALGDFTGDGLVNAADLNLLALNWQSGVEAQAAADTDNVNEGLAPQRLPRTPLNVTERASVAPARLIEPTDATSSANYRRHTAFEEIPTVVYESNKHTVARANRFVRSVYTPDRKLHDETVSEALTELALKPINTDWAYHAW